MKGYPGSMTDRSLTIVLQANPIRIEILRMTFVDDMTQEEIAKKLRMPRRTVCWHIERALVHLREVDCLVVDL